MPAPFVVTPADAPRPLNVVGEHITVLASGAPTGGYEISASREMKVPARRRTTMRGTNRSTSPKARSSSASSKRKVARPGTLVHLPAGTTHWFRFGKGGGEMVSMTSREGASQCSPISITRFRRRSRTSANS